MDQRPESSFPPDLGLRAPAGPLGPSSQLTPSPPSSSHSDAADNSALSVASRGAPGYEQVVRLAERLVQLCIKGYVTDRGVEEVVKLWENLDEVDKGRVRYPTRYKVVENFDKRRIVRPRSRGTWPDASRLVEAIFVQLCVLHPSSTRQNGRSIPRLTLVLRAYEMIQHAVLSNPRLMARTTLQLFTVNRTLLTEWHQRWTISMERNFLSSFSPNRQETGTAAASSTPAAPKFACSSTPTAPKPVASSTPAAPNSTATSMSAASSISAATKPAASSTPAASNPTATKPAATSMFAASKPASTSTPASSNLVATFISASPNPAITYMFADTFNSPASISALYFTPAATSRVTNAFFIPASSTPATSNPAATSISAAPNPAATFISAAPNPAATAISAAPNPAATSISAAPNPAATSISAAPNPAATAIPSASTSALYFSPAATTRVTDAIFRAASSTPAAAVAAAVAVTPPRLPRTTVWRRRLKEQRLAQARALGITHKQRRRMESYTCRRCRRPKTKEFGHSQFRGAHFCSEAQGRSAEDWLEEKRRQKQNG